MTQPTVPAHLVGEINSVTVVCSAPRATHAAGGAVVEEQCTRLAVVTLTVTCTVHGPTRGLALCAEHHNALRALATRVNGLHGCTAPVRVETQVL